MSESTQERPHYENVDLSKQIIEEPQPYETVEVRDSANSYVTPPHSDGIKMEMCTAYGSVPNRR